MRSGRIVAAGVAFALTFGALAQVSAANPKAGAACSKAGKKQVFAGKTFTCVKKKGKGLVWNKGVRVVAAPLPTPSPISTPSPTPSTSPSVEATPTPSLTPTPTTSPSPTPKPSETMAQGHAPDFVNFKGRTVFEISETMLLRRSSLGTAFSTDSRNLNEFSEIRKRAYTQLNQNSRAKVHSNVEFEYILRPEFPTFLIEFTKRELSEAAALWNDYFDQKIKVHVYLVTEKDRAFISDNRWLKQSLPSIFDRFDSRQEPPFIAGGGGFWNWDGDWRGNIYLATASYLNPDQFTNGLPQVAKHEFAHVAQDYGFYGPRTGRDWNELLRVQPQHLREGGANAISFLTAFRNIGWSSDALDWMVWQRSMFQQNWQKVITEEDAIRVMRATEASLPNPAFEMSYAIGALMYEWLIAEFGFDGFKRLLKASAEDSNFDSILRKSVGIGKEEFYKNSAPYVVSVFNRLMPYSN